MSDAIVRSAWRSDARQAGLRKRRAADRRLRRFALGGALLSAGGFALLLGTMLVHGVGGAALAFAPGSESSSASTIWEAARGSLLTVAATLALAFPLGVLGALYLEEYAPPGRWTRGIELSIDALAGVPPILFGLLGLAVFLGTLHLPRASPLVGGLTLALITMPGMVIAARTAIARVPGAIRDAAMAIGASRIQMLVDHLLPLAWPGLLSGALLGMARALGETVPLLVIGMGASIASAPAGLHDPATALPVDIFLSAHDRHPLVLERTGFAILVLLLSYLLMHGLACYLRNRSETRW